MVDPTVCIDGPCGDDALGPPTATVADGTCTITFNTPGTYNFICLIHPEMKGSIVVG